MDFYDIVYQEVDNKVQAGGRDFLLLVSCIFGVTSEQIGAMFTPVRSANTINGYRREGHYTMLGDEGMIEIMEFIQKHYKGKNPLKSLLYRIEKKLSS